MDTGYIKYIDIFINVYVVGIISSIGGVVVGFYLSLYQQKVKSKEDRVEKKKLFLQIVKEELGENIKIIDSNIYNLEMEITQLRDKKFLVFSLSFPKCLFWNSLKYNFDLDFISKEKLTELRDISLLVDNLRENMKSRETHKVTNQSLNNYYGQFIMYNERIIDDSRCVLARLKDYLDTK